MTAVPAVTENAPNEDCADSVPVVSAIVRPPVNATGSTVMFTVAVVADVTVTRLTAMPAPKSAVVVPCWNDVNWPVTAMSSVCPCWPLAGVASTRTGVAAITVKPSASCACSPPVVNVTVRSPGVACADTESVTDAARRAGHRDLAGDDAVAADCGSGHAVCKVRVLTGDRDRHARGALLRRGRRDLREDRRAGGDDEAAAAADLGSRGHLHHAAPVNATGSDGDDHRPARRAGDGHRTGRRCHCRSWLSSRLARSS